MKHFNLTTLGGVLLACLCACSSPAAEKEAVKIGLVAPQTGALAFVGDSFERVAVAAVKAINDRGGVDGHPLELVVLDSATDPATAKAAVEQLIAMGVVGTIGPAISGAVEQVVPVAKANAFPVISPSSTAPSLSTADDGGYVFRNVPNDNIQGVAMAYYLTQVSEPVVTTATVVFEDSTYGAGLGDSFQAAFEAAGGAVSGRVTFAQNGPSENATQAMDVITELQELPEAPSMIVMVGLSQDAKAISQAWKESGAMGDAKWFLTDGARNGGFLEELPAEMVNTRGTAPTFPILGDAYTNLTDVYEATYEDALGEQVFAPNVWDAVHLFAAGLVVQSAAGEEFGGAGLRDAIFDVSKGPGVIVHAGQWRDIVSTLSRGNAIDYDGAAGPNDLDANGEAVGPYEVWQIVDSGSGFEFEQLLFLEASEVQALADL